MQSQGGCRFTISDTVLARYGIGALLLTETGKFGSNFAITYHWIFNVMETPVRRLAFCAVGFISKL